MLITKSLYVAFTKSQKLARWQVNDKAVSKKIQEKMYGGMDGIKIGQSVEDMVKELYKPKPITEVDSSIARASLNLNDKYPRHQTYHERSIKVLGDSPEIIYQPAFLAEEVFVKCDFLKRNEAGTYDMIEVKAKNTIRRSTKAQPLLDDLIADVSIQAWVLKKILGEKFSGKCYLAHTNKAYRRQGDINPQELIVVEEVTDQLMDDVELEWQLELMREKLVLSEDEFTVWCPYDGTDYLTYFGTPPPKNSLRSISRLGSKKKAELYHTQKIALGGYGLEEFEFLKNAKGEKTTAGRFVELRQQGQTIVDKETIRNEMQSLQYPLYFYDYETVSSPIPAFENTSPWQQVVVQYSLHIVAKDGSYTHHEAIIEPGELDNRRILECMIADMNGVGEGTYIVWYQGFENSRNTEWGILFPDYAAYLERINAHTFDLMEIFKRQIYFDRRFEGSCSIKKVLPVLTDISYDNLAVGNGVVAMQELTRLHSGELSNEKADILKKDLLEYCKLDTWAMVRIWQELMKRDNGEEGN